MQARVGQHAVARTAPFIGQNSRYGSAVDERLGGASGTSGSTRANDPSYTSQSQRPALGHSPEFACQVQLPSPLVGFRQSVEQSGEADGSYPLDHLCICVGFEDGDLHLLDVIHGESGDRKVTDCRLEVRISKWAGRFEIDPRQRAVAL